MDKKKEYDETDIQIASIFCNLAFNMQINDYALENVVLGTMKAGDKVNPEKVFIELGWERILKMLDFVAVEGSYLDSEGVIKDMPEEQYRRIFFERNVNELYSEASKTRRRNFDYTRIYGLYNDILDTQITPDYFDFSPDDDNLLHNRAARNFIAAIKLKGLQQGKCVDRYIKKMPYKNRYVLRLVKQVNGRYLLANSDTDSLDYNLALLSVLQFVSSKSAKLYVLKMKKWEQTTLNNNG